MSHQIENLFRTSRVNVLQLELGGLCYLPHTSLTHDQEFAVDTKVSSDIGSRVSVLDRTEARALARKARAQMRKALKGLAEKENIPTWQNAITHWMQQHQETKVSLWQLQQALGMPLVEIWLGLLHSPTPYQWEGTEEFYRDARDFWIGN